MKPLPFGVQQVVNETINALEHITGANFDTSARIAHYDMVEEIQKLLVDDEDTKPVASGSYLTTPATVDRSEKVRDNPDNDRVQANHPAFPVTGQHVLALLKLHGIEQTWLSRNQIKKLTTIRVPRRVGVETDPPPEQEYEQHKDRWNAFIAALPKSPGWKGKFVIGGVHITAGTVIDVVRAYDWNGGWLSYRDQQTAGDKVERFDDDD